jgi:hypothetical protein
MKNERTGTSLFGRTAFMIVVGVAAFAVAANARDILKYLKLRAMSMGAVRH